MTDFRIDPESAEVRARRVTLLVLDCDGVMTDGGVFLLPDGAEVKRFDIQDGQGIVLWRRAGHRVAIVTGRGGGALERRVEELKIDFLVQKSADKLAAFRELIERLGVEPEEVAYAGDDLPDLPLMRRAGLAFAPPNAVEEVLLAAHVVTTRPGGYGAVREMINFMLKAQGRWDAVVGRYLS